MDPRQGSNVPWEPLGAGEAGVVCDAQFIVDHKGEKAAAIIDPETCAAWRRKKAIYQT